jgi:hypothetical protein
VGTRSIVVCYVCDTQIGMIIAVYRVYPGRVLKKQFGSSCIVVCATTNSELVGESCYDSGADCLQLGDVYQLAGG